MVERGMYSRRLLSLDSLGIFIFDCHGHVGPVPTQSVAGDGGEEILVRMMDLVGIDRIAASHMLGICGDTLEGNRLGLACAQRNPGRILHYPVYDPNLAPEAMMADMARYLDDPTTAGIKLHPMWHGTRPDDPRYDPIFEAAAERCLPVLVHTWGAEEVLAAERIGRRFPGLALLIGHSGGADIRAIDQALASAAAVENLYLDLTMSLTYDGLLEYMLAKVPVERILYGSDMSYMDPRTQIGRVVFSRIGDAAVERILGLNFLELTSRRKRKDGPTP